MAKSRHSWGRPYWNKSKKRYEIRRYDSRGHAGDFLRFSLKFVD